MGEAPGEGGLCPVAEEMPQLEGDNLLVHEVYQAARSSAIQITAEDKTYAYIRPESVLAIVQLRLIPDELWPMVIDRIQILNEIENRLRPVKPKRK